MKKVTAPAPHSTWQGACCRLCRRIWQWPGAACENGVFSGGNHRNIWKVDEIWWKIMKYDEKLWHIMKYYERWWNIWNLRYRWKYMALFFQYFLFSFWSTRDKLVREETTGPYPANLQCRQTTPLQVTLAFAAICCNDQQISLHFTSMRCSGQHPRDLECCSFCCTWLSKGAKLFEWKQHKRNQEMYAFN